ncbi:hypothetical protein CSC17_2593 [Klebsiella oxytoca]|nr:hypothetical protein CSC17_2593 [Klebsiella oxytoca]
MSTPGGAALTVLRVTDRLRASSTDRRNAPSPAIPGRAS